MNNRDKFTLVARRRQLKFRYGLTLDQYQDLLNAQNSKCAICECTIDSKRVKTSFAVDHNHITGKIRGLLCNQCNRALGMFDDSVNVLRKALNYLERETH